MALPIDPSELFAEAADIDEARATPLSVSVYIDESAPRDVAAHVRSAFSSDLPTVRLSVSYFEEGRVLPYPADDMAVVVAGLSSGVGEACQAIRDAGVPVMAATTLPSLVKEIAAASGFPLPEGDVASPEPLHTRTRQALEAAGQAVSVAADAVASGAGVVADLVPQAAPVAEAAQGFAGDRRQAVEDAQPLGASGEPYVLDAERTRAFDERMGQWVVAACADKRLAFSIAFPFVGRALANEAVRSTALQNAGIGALPFVPSGADLPLMTLNQAKMTLQIAAAYGRPMGPERAGEIASVIGCAFASRSVARRLCALVPGLKTVFSAGVGYASTLLLGQAMIEYFEGGGNAEGLGRVLQTAIDAGGKATGRVREAVLAKLAERGISEADVTAKVAEVASKVASAVASRARA